MLTPDQALQKIFLHAKALRLEQLDIREANGRVLAADVQAADDLPRFDNSAMDGFALRAGDIRGASKKHPVSLRLIGEIQAGSSFRKKLPSQCAVRISTGAPMPPGADAVVMQEYCAVRGAMVMICGTEPKGANVRFRGEEIRKGRIALRRGTRLNPGSIAWLATMGIRKVSVFRRPRVGLLRTGNEVVEPGRFPRPDQVRDAHGLSLSLALREMGIDLKIEPIVRDNSPAIRRAFSKLMACRDVVLTTGGISVGKHDFFHEAARRIGVRRIFHKISQKPGKPMVFGKKSAKLWFGLPGNPVSSLFCFYHYVRPALLKMTGRSNFLPQWFEAISSIPVRRNPRRTEFMRGRLDRGRVVFARNQGSHCLGSFSDANVLVRINPTGRGRRVSCLFL